MIIESELREVEFLLKVMEYCSDEERYDHLLGLAKRVLKPFIEKSNPRALWLKAGMPNLGEYDLEDYEKEYELLIQKAALGGCAEAQYQHGCNLYDLEEYVEALEFYHKSAMQDFAPAQWCYGLDSLHGVGVEKNIEVGLQFILLAAEQRYEYAVNFMVNAYANGEHGIEKSDKEAQKWNYILKLCENRY